MEISRSSEPNHIRDHRRAVRVFFVRHGESEQNVLEQTRGIEYWQGSWGGLTEKGREEAAAAAEKLAQYPIDAIISSPYDRTKQTAEIIAAKLRKPVEFSSLFIERKNPKEIWEKWEDEPGVKEIVEQIIAHYHDDAWHYSDEENFYDLKIRAREALAYLVSLTKENIVVVTHANFLKNIFLEITRGMHGTREELEHARRKYSTPNGSVTICEYDAENGWKII